MIVSDNNGSVVAIIMLFGQIHPLIFALEIFLTHGFCMGYQAIFTTTLADVCNMSKEYTTLKDDNVSKPPTYHVGVITKSTKKTSFWCGGTLISTHHALTAAHCLKRYNSATIIFPNIQNSTRYTTKTTKLKKHPKWRPDLLLNDLALIELPCTPNIPDLNPIHFIANENIASKLAMIYGWEKTDQKQSTEPVLKIKYVTIISNQECEKRYGHLITKNTICAQGTESNDGCHGFSGSGLVVDGFLVGVLSFGTDPCNSGYPSVYTRVSRYKKWIEKNTTL